MNSVVIFNNVRNGIYQHIKCSNKVPFMSFGKKTTKKAIQYKFRRYAKETLLTYLCCCYLFSVYSA